jgi:mRNA interferase HigB
LEVIRIARHGQQQVWGSVDLVYDRSVGSGIDLKFLTTLRSSIAPVLGASYNLSMRIISRNTLREFWEVHAEAEAALRAWIDDAIQADWQDPTDIKNVYANASILANNRVVFNIRGNKYRLIVHMRYEIGIIFIRFVGTHAEYNKVDAENI